MKRQLENQKEQKGPLLDPSSKGQRLYIKTICGDKNDQFAK